MIRIKSALDLLATGVVVLGVAPLYPYLQLPAQLLLPVALVVGIYCDRRDRYPLQPLAATLLSFLCFGLYAVQVSRANLINPLVNILALLLVVRLLTEKSGRNYLQLFLLSLFALASSSLLTLSIAFLLFLVLVVLGVTVGLVLLTFYAEQPGLRLERADARRVLGVSLILPSVSLLLMLVFFVILPRTQHPLWDFLNPKAGAAVTGFSDTVEPGSVSSMAAQRQPSFRVQSPPLGNAPLYWRCIVLNTLEGSRWSRRPPPPAESARPVGGELVQQTVFPEPRQERYLPLLDLPQELQGLRHDTSADRVFLAARPPEQRVKYQTSTRLGGHLQLTQGFDPAFYLATPAEVSPRLRALAASIRKEAAGAGQRLERAEDHFRQLHLSYSNTDLPTSADPLDEFLFDKKQGYCEYFASSFALVLRLAEVPARLVGGYLGGNYNELGGYYVVTEDRAHVWVEALIDDRWHRVDPSRLAINAGVALDPSRHPTLSASARLLDTVNYYWNQAVITYDLGRQFELLRQTNRSMRRLRFELHLWPLAAGLGALLGLWFAGRWLRGRLVGSVEQRLLQRFLATVRRRHHLTELPPDLGLRHLAARVDDPACREFAEIFGGAVYRDRPLSRAELLRLRHLLGQVGVKKKD